MEFMGWVLINLRWLLPPYYSASCQAKSTEVAAGSTSCEKMKQFQNLLTLLYDINPTLFNALPMVVFHSLPYI